MLGGGGNGVYWGDFSRWEGNDQIFDWWGIPPSPSPVGKTLQSCLVTTEVLMQRELSSSNLSLVAQD